MLITGISQVQFWQNERFELNLRTFSKSILKNISAYITGTCITTAPDAGKMRAKLNKVQCGFLVFPHYPLAGM
jgi:hypothetical protein